ncbi:MAG: glutamyl-tRNA reductase [Clostridium sp.]
MIVLLGIKKHTPIWVREKLSVKNKNYEGSINILLKTFKACAILNTCNRIEIYINCDNNFKKQFILDKVFEALMWEEELSKNMFTIFDEGVYKHLFELSCGFHSKIVGEDQILGQIREVHGKCIKLGALNKELLHLFESAIACGKEFRTQAKLYEIPVSSASIVANKSLEYGFNNLMIIGYGEIGALTFQYIKGKRKANIFIVVRDKEKYSYLNGEDITLIDYKEKIELINNMDIVISCTSAPHHVISKDEIKTNGKDMIIFDLALPRDVEAGVEENRRVSLYNIDEISRVDDENKELRTSRMNENKWVIKKHLDEFISWISSRRVSPLIRKIKERESQVCYERKKTFINKAGESNSELVEILLKSTSDYYVNRAIEILKEEVLEGDGEKCMEIIERIFLKEN